MPYLLVADLVVVVHVLFVLFVVAGGLLLFRWPLMALLHLPAVIWGAVIEFLSLTCPLTPLELWLRSQGGGETYAGGFVEQYLLPILYPGALTRELQIALGFLVLAGNLCVYALAFTRAERLQREARARRRRGPDEAGASGSG